MGKKEYKRWDSEEDDETEMKMDEPAPGTPNVVNNTGNGKHNNNNENNGRVMIGSREIESCSLTTSPPDEDYSQNHSSRSLSTSNIILNSSPLRLRCSSSRKSSLQKKVRERFLRSVCMSVCLSPQLFLLDYLVFSL